MKVGILGTGKIVQEFLPWLVEHAPFTVQALCSTPRSAEKAQELCRQYGVPQHTTNYLELLQWVDVVYIAVPNLQHVRFARVALEAGKHVIVEKPLAPSAAQTEELVALARHKKVFLFEAVTTQYLENYAKIRELLPRVGTVRLVQCNFSQYSSRYDAFCAGDVQPAFDPACAGGALMDLGVYNVSYIVGLFGEPNQAKYTANMERGIDTSGILTMDYSGFKAVSIAAKDCAAPARYIIQGTKGYIMQKSTANCCGGITFHPNEGKEEHYNLNGGRPRQAAEFEAFARALENGDQEIDFSFDLTSCTFCGTCADFCATKSITLTDDYMMVGTTPEDFMVRATFIKKTPPKPKFTPEQLAEMKKKAEAAKAAKAAAAAAQKAE